MWVNRQPRAALWVVGLGFLAFSTSAGCPGAVQSPTAGGSEDPVVDEPGDPPSPPPSDTTIDTNGPTEPDPDEPVDAVDPMEPVEPPAEPEPGAILVSIVMHVEEPPGYPDFENDPEAFEQHRTALVRFADLLYENGAAFNWMSDWNFLKAVALYDGGAPETNGKHVVRYLKEDLGFEVDPHAHESLYNYADVAYLLEQLDVVPSGIVGGFLADPPQESLLEYFWAPITGAQYPAYTWTAEVLWGAGSGNHVNDEALWTSGVWKPVDRGHFLEHDPDAPLPAIGNFGGTWENLDLLLALREAGRLTDGIHTCTIMTNQREIVEEGYIESFEVELVARRDNPGIRWVGLSEVIQIWEEEYGSGANTLSYEEAQAMTP